MSFASRRSRHAKSLSIISPAGEATGIERLSSSNTVTEHSKTPENATTFITKAASGAGPPWHHPLLDLLHETAVASKSMAQADVERDRHTDDDDKQQKPHAAKLAVLTLASTKRQRVSMRLPEDRRQRARLCVLVMR